MQLPEMIKSIFFYTRKRYNANHRFRNNALQTPRPRAVEEIRSSNVDIKIENESMNYHSLAVHI